MDVSFMNKLTISHHDGPVIDIKSDVVEDSIKTFLNEVCGTYVSKVSILALGYKDTILYLNPCLKIVNKRDIVDIILASLEYTYSDINFSNGRIMIKTRFNAVNGEITASLKIDFASKRITVEDVELI